MAITISGENNNDKILASDGVIDQISGFSIVGVVTATSFTGDLTGNVTGNLTGNVNSTSPLLLQTGGSERFRITGYNELGIAGANYGTAGQVLTSGGSGNAVTWSTLNTFSSSIYVADSIIHQGDTNTKISFPAADTVALETGGTQGVRLTSAQKLLVGDHTVSRSIGNSEHIIQTEGINAGENGISLYSFTSNQHAAHFSFGKSRNNSTVADNDFLGHIIWCAHDGTDVNSTAARITASIDGATGSNDTPGRLEFYTTSDGSHLPTERLRINSSGHVVPAADSSYDLGLTGTRFRNVYADTLYGGGANITGIVNASISASAAIAGSKITPNFGSQTLTAGLGYFTNHLNTTGHFALTGGSVEINLNRASHSPTYKMRLTGGSYTTMNFRITDDTNSEDRFIIRQGGDIEIPGDLGIGHPVNFSATNISKFGSYSTLHIKGPSNNGAAIRLQDNGDTADSDDFVIYKNYAAAYLRVNGTDPLKFYMNGADRLMIDSNGYVGIADSDSTVGLSINKFGTQPVTNGNTYPYPAGNWSTVWNTTTANSTDYWCGFVGGYNVSSATVNISLAPNTFNLNNQQGIYIAGEATSTTTADFTLGKIIGGSQTGASNSAGAKRATKSEMLRVTSAGQLAINSTGTTSTSVNLLVYGNADNSDIATFSGGDWSRGLKISTSANNLNDQNVIYNAQGQYGQHIFSTGGNIVGRFEHDQSGFISENTASGDGDTEVGVALQNDYSSWGVIYKNDWIGQGSGWGTFWAGNSGARYRRVSSDNNPNEHVMVGSGNKRFTFDLDGGGHAYFDGSLTQNAYDYAEYFEWEDGNPLNEDRRGYSVFVNSNGKIEKATDSTNTAEIIGVISGTAAVVGDAAIYDWQGKWQVDEWGTLVTEVVKQVSWKDDEGKRHSYEEDKIPSGITVPSHASYRQHKRRILNSDYDDSKDYVPRDMRQEWDTVGLLGKVRVRDDSPKNPNWKFIKTINGKKLWLIR